MNMIELLVSEKLPVIDADWLTGRQAIIYALIDSDTRMVHYVGQTYEPASRLRQHVIESMNDGVLGQDKRKKQAWIRDVYKRGGHIIMKIIYVCTFKEEMNFVEGFFIRYFQRAGCDLYNLQLWRSNDIGPIDRIIDECSTPEEGVLQAVDMFYEEYGRRIKLARRRARELNLILTGTIEEVGFGL